ncbi:hypothetical protein ACFQ3Z_33930 [Streptomyces nogalater]
MAYGPELPIVRRYWRSEFGRRPSNPVSMVVPDLRAVLAAVVAGAASPSCPATWPIPRWRPPWRCCTTRRSNRSTLSISSRPPAPPRHP